MDSLAQRSAAAWVFHQEQLEENSGDQLGLALSQRDGLMAECSSAQWVLRHTQQKSKLRFLWTLGACFFISMKMLFWWDMDKKRILPKFAECDLWDAPHGHHCLEFRNACDAFYTVHHKNIHYSLVMASSLTKAVQQFCLILHFSSSGINSYVLWVRDLGVHFTCPCPLFK